MTMVDLRQRPRGRDDAVPLFRRDAPPGNAFIRVVTASAIAAVRRMAPHDVAVDLWPTDRVVCEFLTRAATAPAMTTVTGWATELVRKVVVDALDALGPASAAVEVMRRGLVLAGGSSGVISAPGFVAGAGNASFVAEGDPIPVRQLASSAATLNPHKLATIAVLTRELIESSNAEAAITDALVRSSGAALDAVFFDANAETSARSAGLKYNVAASSASSASDLFEAVFEDVATLVNAVAPVGGAGPYVLVASPGRAVGMELRFTNSDIVTVLASTAAGNDLYAIAPAALVAAVSPNPDVEAATAATLVMDTAPGAAGTTASGEKSMFQTDSTAVKVRWPVSWAMRDPRGFAWLTPTWK